MHARSAAHRRTLVVVLVVLLAAFAVVALLVARDPALTRFDLTVSRWFATHRSQPVTAIAWVFTWIGGVVGMTLLTIVSVSCFAMRHKYFQSWLVAVTMIGQGFAVTLIKLVVARPRPPKGLWAGPDVYTRSFPSGHTTATTVFFGVLVLLVAGYAARIVCAAFVVGVAFSRVYLGYHYVSDVLGGWLLGGAVVVIAALALTARRHPATSQQLVTGP